MVKILLLAGLSVAVPALAGEAHVCKSQPVANSSANAELTDDTVFKCGEGIYGTIPALARDGWKIVQQTDQADVTDPSKTWAQLIIQKD
ncbi:hypothetical protein AB295_19265 [Salmonella enterica]|uniref:Secreted protein n=1 Tax=Salmonella enterica subsp. enterica serovar Rubislaw str. ATCC 10717 TaxID=938143 RepID=A0A6W0P1L5_SALRU|nr:hypothetical protein [Salmonella enterica]EBY1810410.1 hypothetical protein [Salmonella enterica subsp. enterica serovar Rubislaw]EDJ9214329.1 hypothetical protein [Salmonella enterica subsp. enterica serovar Bareilly]EIS1621777.1 hypothetical protein [Salmonella enterica subsp. enterica serovar Sandiego]HAE7714853.1 hypothetical protein [Salmonella enterica subsp. enterica]APW04202.1 hypothetical protein SEERU717_23800 [Salmonella enterica subsp. enterica serovar Rubislaw str. ATCC 10717]